MTILHIQAIKDLPDEYVLDGMETLQYEDVIICVHPNRPPLIYKDEEGWHPLGIQKIAVVKIKGKSDILTPMI